MNTRVDASRLRTIIGLGIAVAFVPVMLGITACLQTPIGDPEQGWADPRVSGAWYAVGAAEEGGPGSVWLFEPWDQRTWLVTYVNFYDASESAEAGAEDSAAAAPDEVEPAEDAIEPATRPNLTPAEVEQRLAALADETLAKLGEVVVFKGWLTSIGDRRFLVLEPKADVSADRGFRPEAWFAFRLVLKGDRMELAGLDLDRDDLGEATTRGEAEAIIARHAADPGFYEDSISFYRIAKSSYDEVDDAIGRSGLGF